MTSSGGFALFLLAATCFAVAGGQLLGSGSCPNMSVMDNLNIRRFMGKWYEIERYFIFFHFAQKCVTSEFQMARDGTIHLLNKGISKWTKKEKQARGLAFIPDPKEPAKLTLTIKPGSIFQRSGRYWILDTDYNSYALVYSCERYLFFHTKLVWILSRQISIPEQTRIHLYDKMEKLGLSHTKFILTDQHNCPDHH